MNFSELNKPKEICEQLQSEINDMDTAEEKLPVFRAAWGRLKDLKQSEDHNYAKKVRHLAKIHLLEE